MKILHWRHRILSLFLLICILTALTPMQISYAQERKSEKWLAVVLDNGEAEITGYTDHSVQKLVIPDRIEGAWVTSIGAGAFADCVNLRTVQIPGAVISIDSTAFSLNTALTIRALNGTEALRFAKQHGFHTVNTSNYDFFDDIIDLSDMLDTQWSIGYDGLVHVDAPHAARIKEGSKLYLPSCAIYPSGAPVELYDVQTSNGELTARYTELSFYSAVASYHAEGVELSPDLGRLRLADGVTFDAQPKINALGAALNSSVPVINLKKTFGSGITVDVKVEAVLSADVDVDYHWLDMQSANCKVKSGFTIDGNATYSREETWGRANEKIELFSVPLVGNGLVSAWLTEYLQMNLNGELSVSAEISSTFSYHWTKEGGLKTDSRQDTANATLKTLSASAQLASMTELSLEMGFPKMNRSIKFASVSCSLGVLGEGKIARLKDGCWDIDLYFVFDGNVRLGIIQDKSSIKTYLSAALPSIKHKLKHFHWEGTTSQWQEDCTATTMLTVSFAPGNGIPIPAQTVARGEMAFVPDDPQMDGFTLTGWYTVDNIEWNFCNGVTEDMTLYAHWKDAPTPTPVSTPTPTPNPTPTPTPIITPKPGEGYPIGSILNEVQTMAALETDFNEDEFGNRKFSLYHKPGMPSAITIPYSFDGAMFWRFDCSDGAGTRGNSSLIAVRFSSGFISVPKNCLDSCPNLTTVYLPSTIKRIEDRAFSYCDSLSHINLPYGLTSIGENAFDFDTGLTNMNLPNGLATIESGAFRGCSGLTQLVIPSSVRTIGFDAFTRCSGLTSLTIPDTVEYLSRQGDLPCLRNLTMPAVLFDAFLANCQFASEYPNVEHITLTGAFGDTIPKERFRNLNALLSIDFDGSNVKHIGDNAFTDAGLLPELPAMPKLVTIGNYAFSDCDSLNTVQLPQTIETIGEQAFASCDSLTDVSIGGSKLTTLPNGAFISCSSLTNVLLPESLQHIKARAFSNCTKLETLELPEHLTSLGNYAFANCTSLREITIYPDVTDIGLAVFDGSGLEILHANLDSEIAAYVRANYSGVTIIPITSDSGAKLYPVYFKTQSGTRLGSMMAPAGEPIANLPSPVWDNREFTGWFKNWFRTDPWTEADVMPEEPLTLYAGWRYAVTSITFEDTDKVYLQSMAGSDEELFLPMQLDGKPLAGLVAEAVPAGVKTVHLPSTLIDVQPGAFRKALTLEAILVDENNPVYYSKDGILYSRSGALICYPAGKTETEFAVPDGVTRLAAGAFIENAALTTIVLPASLTELDSMAIECCDALKRIDFQADPQSLAMSAITGCNDVRLYGPALATTLTDFAARAQLPYNQYIVLYVSDGEPLLGLDTTVGAPLVNFSGPSGEWRSLQGWSETEDGASLLDFSTAVMPAHDLTLYAIWHSLFETRATDGGVELIAYTGTDSTITVPETFNGQTLVSIAENAFDGIDDLKLICERGSAAEAFATTYNIDCELITHWLTFQTNRGTQFPPQALCATDPIILPEVRRDGYTFNGWFADEMCQTPWMGNVMPSDDLTLYAGWTFAGGGPGDQFEFETTSEGLTITGYLGEDDAVTIPSSINGVTVRLIGSEAFMNCENLTSVLVPDTVTQIGERAFMNCVSLDWVDIGASVETIGAYAFTNCEGMWDVNIPASVKVIGESAFRNDSLLAVVSLADGLEEIGAYAFADCTNLSSASLPNTVTTIGAYAFAGNTIMSTVNIPTGITRIEAGTFQGCSSLTNVMIWNCPIESIGSEAFAGCTTMLFVDLPSTCRTIAPDAFLGCTNLNRYNMNNGLHFCSIGGVLYSADATKLVAYPPAKIAAFLKLDTRVETICAGAFRNSLLREISIGGNVREIAPDAFDNSKLSKVSVYSGSYADQYFSLNHPEITLVRRSVLQGDGFLYEVCSDGIHVVAPNGSPTELNIPAVIDALPVTQIDANAFSYCTSLCSLSVPSSVKLIDSMAFTYCTSLRSLSLADGIQAIGESAFEFDGQLTSVVLPNTVTSLGKYTFASCKALSDVTLSTGLKVLEYAAFADDPIQSIVIPEGVEQITYECFASCKLVSVTLPASINRIDDDSFDSCPMTVIHVPAGCYARSWCEDNLPDSLLHAPGEALRAALNLPASLKQVGAEAFAGTDATSVLCPDGVETLDARSFADNTHLQWIVLPNSIRFINATAFDGCNDPLIVGESGSEAERFANQNELRFLEKNSFYGE